VVIDAIVTVDRPPPEVCTPAVPSALPVGVSVNVTVPVGYVLPVKVYFNLAVNVTLCPTAEGFRDELRVALVAVN